MIDPSLHEQLVQQARKLAEERKWKWNEPVNISSGVYEGEPVWIVRTNAMTRGSNIRVTIRKSDQQIVHSGYLGR